MAIPYTMSADWPRLVANEINNAPWQRKSVVSKTAAYAAQQGDDVILCDAAGAAFSVTLPAAAQFSGLSFIIKKVDASVNAVTIDGNGAETIDGAATVALATQYESLTVVSDGTGWAVI